MKRDLIITSNTAQLSLLRFQNSCLDEFLKQHLEIEFVIVYWS